MATEAEKYGELLVVLQIAQAHCASGCGDAGPGGGAPVAVAGSPPPLQEQEPVSSKAATVDAEARIEHSEAAQAAQAADRRGGSPSIHRPATILGSSLLLGSLRLTESADGG